MHDVEKLQGTKLADSLLAEQNFTAAVIAGAVATILAAFAYGITVDKWPFTYGFAAAGTGIVIGASMQFLGRGIAPKFAVAAAAYTIAGCLLGNLFVKVISRAQAAASSPFDIIGRNSIQELAQWTIGGLTLIHMVFWFVAVWFAVFLVKRPLTRAQRFAIGSYELQR